MKHRYVPLLALALLFTPAATLLSQDKVKESEYYPLKVGTTWGGRAAGAAATVRAAKQEKVGDVLCSLLETEAGGKVVATEHVAVGDDGLYRYTMLGQKVDPAVRFLKLPPKKGDTWRVASKLM